MKNQGWHKGELNEEEKEALINKFLPFIKYTAYRLAWRLPPQLTTDDLVSVGIMGLLDALNRYREAEAKLNTFVEYRIKGAMLDELRAQEWMPKSIKEKLDKVKNANIKLEKKLGRMPEPEEIAASLEISLEEYYNIIQNSNTSAILRFEDFSSGINDGSAKNILDGLADPNAKSPLDIMVDSALKETLAACIDEMPEKEKLVLSLYYWEELTMKEIGRVLNITEGRVCQLHNQALIRLRARVELRP